MHRLTPDMRSKDGQYALNINYCNTEKHSVGGELQQTSLIKLEKWWNPAGKENYRPLPQIAFSWKLCKCGQMTVVPLTTKLHY